MLRSQIHAFPSVAPVTTTPALTLPPILTNSTASILSPSVWPPRAPTTSPLLRLTTRTPPEAPPITASVEEGLTLRDVMPSKLNRPSPLVSLKIGVGDRGSQNIRVPWASAVMILLPGQCKLLDRIIAGDYKCTIRCEVTAVHRACMACKHLHCIPRGYF